METKIKMSGDTKEIKSSFESKAVMANLTTALQEAKTICTQKKYVVEGSIDTVLSDINLENATLSSRKKLAKKIYYFNKKKSLKTMSALFTFIRKRFFGEEYKFSVKPSLLEQEIISLRKKYKEHYAESEKNRILLKEKKIIFNQKNAQ